MNSSSLETYEKIFEISKKILSQTQLDRLFDLILDEAITLCNAERGFIILIQEQGFEIKSARNMDKEGLKKSREKISQTIIREVLNQESAVITLDAGADEKLKKSESIHRMKLRSILALPLRIGNQIKGVLYLDNRFAAGVFQETQKQILTLFADQASLALSHASLLKDNLNKQEELIKQQETIQKLNQSLEEKIHLQSQELKQARLQIESLTPSLSTSIQKFSEIIGSSQSMQEVFRVMDRIIDSNVPVYIHGESGTGKELIAKALHQYSPRKFKTYIATNCASYSETLLESELFGHVRGAFTGADKDKKGIFEFAHQGTVFLDEVGDMSLAMQAKLLRVLQEGEIRPVGSNQTIKIDVRVISATNKDLATLVKEGKFRKDLFYRLNVVKMNLPPLRDRRSDIPLLVDHFMKKNKMGIPENFLSITPEAIKILMAYVWPGNIRELENEISRALVMGKGAITGDLFSEQLREKFEMDEILSHDLNLYLQVERLEKRLIEHALQKSGGNQSDAAELLGISRFAL
ncbi:MAG: sigma 54-interacting transcriptional regulator, partial [Deltaproteobacteria bacterium]|nr:sigma 54-interacting transcriptional regulator [Deltaproteobacteria bacterium]